VVIAVLLVDPAGSTSLLLINTSREPRLILLTFCPYTGKINTNPLAEGLLTK